MKTLLACILGAVGLVICFESLEAQQSQASVSYADVASIFNQRCIMCHSGATPPHGLKLDSYASIVAGAAEGPVVVAGAPGKSELVRRIRGKSQPRMPMGGPPWLAVNDIALIELWIAGGAPEGKASSVQQQTQVPAAGVPPTGAPTAASTGAGSQLVTYSQVAPILMARCVKCHVATGLMGPAPEGLRLDSYEEVLASGERAVVIPGSPDASDLLRRIRGQSTPRMPMDGPPYLSDTETSLIGAWIAAGARDDSGTPRPLPVGAEVRLRGKLSARWALDGTPLVVDNQTRLDKNPAVGDTVEVRGVIQEDGRIRATRIRVR
jgi:uncharacterized membrane protein